MSAELGSLVLSEKANQLAHDAIGILTRRLTTSLLVLSAVLGYVAGFTGLADLAGKTAVIVLGLLAGVVSTGAVLALTTFKPGDHLAIAGQYEQLLWATTSLAGREEDAKLEQYLREFMRVVEKTRDRGIPLSNGQVRKYEKEAKEDLGWDFDKFSPQATLPDMAVLNNAQVPTGSIPLADTPFPEVEMWRRIISE